MSSYIDGQLGMIVRADFGRGLAHQTYSFWKNLKPDVTVVIDNREIDHNADPDNPEAAWPLQLDRYPGAIISPWKGYTAPLIPSAIEALRSCAVIYTAETHYDESLQSHPSILHVNPEFYRGAKATHYWYATSWRTAELPSGDIVPTPIDDDDLLVKAPGPGRILHIAGHRAAGDRNGTNIVTKMMKTETTFEWKLAHQDGLRMHPRSLQTTVLATRSEDRWSIYDDCSILVYPRRYGGQSLQVNEAMARGLAVVMSDVEPNPETWPIIPVATRPGGNVRTPSGRIPLAQTMAHSLREALHDLQDLETLQHHQVASLIWARRNSWSEWLPKIRKVIDAY